VQNVWLSGGIGQGLGRARAGVTPLGGVRSAISGFARASGPSRVSAAALHLSLLQGGGTRGHRHESVHARSPGCQKCYTRQAVARFTAAHAALRQDRAGDDAQLCERAP